MDPETFDDDVETATAETAYNQPGRANAAQGYQQPMPPMPPAPPPETEAALEATPSRPMAQPNLPPVTPQTLDQAQQPTQGGTQEHVADVINGPYRGQRHFLMDDQGKVIGQYGTGQLPNTQGMKRVVLGGNYAPGAGDQLIGGRVFRGRQNALGATPVDASGNMVYGDPEIQARVKDVEKTIAGIEQDKDSDQNQKNIALAPLRSQLNQLDPNGWFRKGGVLSRQTAVAKAVADRVHYDDERGLAWFLDEKGKLSAHNLPESKKHQLELQKWKLEEQKIANEAKRLDMEQKRGEHRFELRLKAKKALTTKNDLGVEVPPTEEQIDAFMAKHDEDEKRHRQHEMAREGERVSRRFGLPTGMSEKEFAEAYGQHHEHEPATNNLQELQRRHQAALAKAMGLRREKAQAAANLANAPLANFGQPQVQQPTQTVSGVARATPAAPVQPEQHMMAGLVNLSRQRDAWAKDEENPKTWWHSQKVGVLKKDYRTPGVYTDREGKRYRMKGATVLNGFEPVQ